MKTQASGSSAGSWDAASFLVDAFLCELASDILKGTVEARKRMLGPFSPSFDLNKLLAQSLRRLLPDDVHLRVSGHK